MAVTLTRVSGYPAKDIDKSGVIWRDRKIGVYTDIVASVSHADIGKECEFDASLVLVKATVSRDEDGARGYVDYTYQNREATILMDTNQIEYSVTSNGEPTPIELHPNFVCKWCYSLFKHPDTVGDYSGKDSDKDPSCIPTENYLFMWLRNAKDAPTCEDGKRKWIQVQAPTLSATLEYYIEPKIVIEQTKYWSDANKIGNVLTSTGKFVIPTKTFGLPNTSDRWLCVGSQVRRDGRKWSVTTSMQYDPKGYYTEVYS